MPMSRRDPWLPIVVVIVVIVLVIFRDSPLVLAMWAFVQALWNLAGAIVGLFTRART